MKGFRLAFRLAWREAVRRKAAALLTVALVAVPIAGSVFLIGLSWTMTPSAEDQRRWDQGTAEMVVSAPAVADIEAVLSRLPEGSRSVEVVTTEAVARHAERSVGLHVTDAPLDEPILRPTRRLTDGRAPGPGEVAMSRTALRRLRATVGDRVRIVNADVAISGVVQDAGDHNRALAVVPHGSLPATAGSASAFVDLPPGASPSAGRTGDAYVMTDIGFRADRRAESGSGTVLVSTIVLVLAAVVASAALAVAARRHIRDLGILAAAGANQNQLRGFVTARGAAVAVGGVVLGLPAGLLLLLATSPFMATWAGKDVGGLEVPWSFVGASLFVAVVATTAAAWMPAFATARIPVLAALGGRRPTGPLRARGPALGLVLVGLGTAEMWWISSLDYGIDVFNVFGIVMAVLGTALLTPAIVVLVGRLGGLVGGVTRLSIRDLARHRSRSASVLTSLVAAVALAVGAAVGLAFWHQAELDEQAFGPAADQVVVSANDVEAVGPVADRVAELLGPGVRRAERVRAATRSAPTAADPEGQLSPVFGVVQGDGLPSRFGPDGVLFGYALIDGPGLLDALGAPTAVPAGEAIVFLPSRTTVDARLHPVVDRKVVERSIRPAVVVTDHRDLWGTMVLRPPAVARLGLVPAHDGAIFRAARPLTDAQRAELDTLASTLTGAGAAGPGAAIEYQEPVTSLFGPTLGLLFIAFAFSAGVVWLGLSLARAEGAGERAVLAALGLDARGAAAGAAAGALGLVVAAVVVAVPIALVPSALIINGGTTGELVIPWGLIAAVCIGTPALAALVAWVGGWSTGRKPVATLALSAD